MADYAFYQCSDDGCGLRFPAAADWRRGCPRCDAPVKLTGSATSTVGREFHDGALSAPSETNPALSPTPGKAPRSHLEALLDNVRSLYNVGSIFRTADGAGIQRLHLCGITPTPENTKLAKTALGAEATVMWRYGENAANVAAELQREGWRIVALEAHPRARSIFGVRYHPRTVLVVGNELAGIDPELVAQADECVAIPMAGFKRSLNVATAFGIAAYVLAWCTAQRPA